MSKQSDRWVDSLFSGPFNLTPSPAKYPRIVLTRLVHLLDDPSNTDSASIAGAYIRWWRQGVTTTFPSDRWADRLDCYPDKDLVRNAIRMVTFADAARERSDPGTEADYLRGAEAYLRTLWKRQQAAKLKPEEHCCCDEECGFARMWPRGGHCSCFTSTTPINFMAPCKREQTGASDG